MELQTLRNFLAIAREGNITHAAKALHISQPSLSRQLLALEQELGCELYERNHSGIVLTDYGMMLARYATSIVDLADKAKSDITTAARDVSGSVHIGAGETRMMDYLADAMNATRKKYPLVSFAIYAGSTEDLMNGLIRGQYDFLLECEVRDHKKLNVLKFPETDTWGVLARQDSKFGSMKNVTPEDLIGEDLIGSRQGNKLNIKRWAGRCYGQYNFVANYSLPLNGRFLVRRGVGSMLTYEDLFDANSENGLCFVPFEPRLESVQGLVWRNVTLTKPAQAFLDTLQEMLAE